MDPVNNHNPKESTESAIDRENLHQFVRHSARDAELVKEFTEITERYEAMSQALLESGIPSRRAEIVLRLINSTTPPRTYRDVAHMLNLSQGRINQLIQSERRRNALRPTGRSDDA